MIQDVHTSRWIINKCFKGDLIRGRTVVLVVCSCFNFHGVSVLKYSQTHNVAMASPLADFVVSIGVDGRIASQGSVSEALAKDSKLAEEFKHEEEAIELDENEDVDEVAGTTDGKLIVAEEIEVGHVSLGACMFFSSFLVDGVSFADLDLVMLFLRAVGGKWPILFWVHYLGSDGMSEICDALEMWWLGWWAQQYIKSGHGEVSVA